MRFEIFKYNMQGKEVSAGSGELSDGRLSWNVTDADLNQKLNKVKKAGSVPQKQLNKIRGRLSEIVIDVSISNSRFLSALSDWLIHWNFVEVTKE